MHRVSEFSRVSWVYRGQPWSAAANSKSCAASASAMASINPSSSGSRPRFAAAAPAASGESGRLTEGAGASSVDKASGFSSEPLKIFHKAKHGPRLVDPPGAVFAPLEQYGKF